MTEAMVIELMMVTMKTGAMLTAPIIVTILIVGVLSQVFQTVTQLKDMALNFVPKAMAGGIVVMLMIPWYIQVLRSFSQMIFSMIGKASM